MVWSYLAQWLRISPALLIFNICSFWFTSSLENFPLSSTFNQQVLIKYVIHPVDVAENKLNPLPMWSLHSNFVPLLPDPSPKYGYFTSLDFNCLFSLISMKWLQWSPLESQAPKMCIFFWHQFVYISACLLDIISSSSTKKIDSCPKLKSFITDLSPLCSYLGKLHHSSENHSHSENSSPILS